MQAHQEYKQLAFCKIAQNVLSSIVRLTLILCDADIALFVYSIALDTVLLTTIYLFVNHKQRAYIAGWQTATVNQVWAITKNSLPVFFSSLSVILYTKMDQWMIAHMLGISQLGIYSTAVRTVEATYFIPVVTATVALPLLLKANKANSTTFLNLLRQLLTLMFYTGLAVTLFISLLSDEIVLFLFGPEYTDAASCLMLLSLATIFVYFGTITTPALIAINLENYIFIRTATAAVANFGLNFTLIPLYGINGAALATLISAFLAGFVFDSLAAKTRFLIPLKLRSASPKSLLRAIN
ncbi:hypothetical protein GCM10008090_14570 [Arenicella chitinivorans]|uniref:Polysaccharide biosynthesis protein C-terminal domain-containing protein n=2 Tax=Arenicella chitinivorans TaxID=1329800 RepID=A0A918RR41_9GAMM|nr:hypothetical protein GCM10008090_14570 [Arenicella chitinivorans]